MPTVGFERFSRDGAHATPLNDWASPRPGGGSAILGELAGLNQLGTMAAQRATRALRRIDKAILIRELADQVGEAWPPCLGNLMLQAGADGFQIGLVVFYQ